MESFEDKSLQEPSGSSLPDSFAHVKRKEIKEQVNFIIMGITKFQRYLTLKCFIIIVLLLFTLFTIVVKLIGRK